ncbi:unnamed protein product [Arctogadus glacialis]
MAADVTDLTDMFSSSLHLRNRSAGVAPSAPRELDQAGPGLPRSTPEEEEGAVKPHCGTSARALSGLRSVLWSALVDPRLLCCLRQDCHV